MTRDCAAFVYDRQSGEALRLARQLDQVVRLLVTVLFARALATYHGSAAVLLEVTATRSAELRRRS